MSCQHCTTLAEENAFLRRQLGLDADQDAAARLAVHWSLTTTERRLLAFLHGKRGVPVRGDAIMDALYADRTDEPFPEIVKVYVSKIRRKVGKGLISTSWGQGYALTREGLALCDAIVAGNAALREAAE